MNLCLPKSTTKPRLQKRRRVVWRVKTALLNRLLTGDGSTPSACAMLAFYTTRSIAKYKILLSKQLLRSAAVMSIIERGHFTAEFVDTNSSTKLPLIHI